MFFKVAEVPLSCDGRSGIHFSIFNALVQRVADLTRPHPEGRIVCTYGGPMSVSMSRRSWYVIQCKAREDGRALEHLQRQAFYCYAPTVRAGEAAAGPQDCGAGTYVPGLSFRQTR